MAENIVKKYPWLSITTTLEKYIEPDYYDKILKNYIFNGKHDLDFLKEAAESVADAANIVEFGPGTGRATSVVIAAIKDIKSLTLVELSDRMLEKCKERFSSKKFIEYINSDTIDFILSNNKQFDFAFSLWSFSHSVHQSLKSLGLEAGKIKVREAITKLLTNSLKPGGSFFLIHFDSLSQEQSISIKQRRKDNFVFQENTQQSPSKLLIDEILAKLKNNRDIDFGCQHFIGEPIKFNSMDEALEYYLNFHMESHFNESKNIQVILEELTNDIKKFQSLDGSIKITPGCFIYNIARKN